MKSNKQWLIKSKLSNLFKFCFGFSWNILMPGASNTRQSWLRYACNSNTKAKKKYAKIDEETDTNKRKIQASRIKEDAGSKIEDEK